MRRFLAFMLFAALAACSMPIKAGTGALDSYVFTRSLTKCGQKLVEEVPVEKTGDIGCDGFVRLLRAGEKIDFRQGQKTVETWRYVGTTENTLMLETNSGKKLLNPYDPVKIGEVTAGYIISYSKFWDAAVVYVPITGLEPLHKVDTLYLTPDFAGYSQTFQNVLGSVYAVPKNACLSTTMKNGEIGKVSFESARPGGVMMVISSMQNLEDVAYVLGQKDGNWLVLWYGLEFSECV